MSFKACSASFSLSVIVVCGTLASSADCVAMFFAWSAAFTASNA